MASVTNFIRKLSFLIGKKPREKRDEGTKITLNNWEDVLMEIQKILFWDDPFHSCICVISVNIVFWLIIFLEFKFYGILFATLFILTIRKLWQEHISRFFIENKPQSENPVSDVPKPSKTRNLTASEMKPLFKKFQTVISNTFVKTRLFRQTQPGRFCILTCMCFLWLSILGESMSGVMILYILLMFMMTVPGVLIHFLPPYVINSISNLIFSSHKVSENEESELDDLQPYLPETSVEALELLKLAADVQVPKEDDDEESNDILLEKISDHTSDTTESVCSKFSFYPQSATMPSPENSMDFLDLELPQGEKYYLNENQSSDIHFQSKHFEGDSSSEEDFVKGLNISESEKKIRKQEPNKNDQTSLFNAENLISIGTNLLASSLNKKNLRKESSSDTESFEMISEEEI